MVLVEVRIAQSTDAQIVAHLLKSAQEELTSRRGGPQLIEELAAYAKDLESLDEVVGVWHGVIVGVGSLGRDVRQREIGVITSLYVDPEYRRLGIGSEIMDYLISSAKLRGLRRIEAPALPGDAPWKNLLEAAGLKARVLRMSSELG